MATIETAVVASFLSMMIMGLVDVSTYAAARLKVQQGINRGLEMSLVGGPNLSATSIQSEAATQANVSTGTVTVTQWLTCAGVTTTWTGSCTSSQEIARYTQIQIATSFTPSFVGGTIWQLVNSDDVIPISITGVIRIQ